MTGRLRAEAWGPRRAFRGSSSIRPGGPVAGFMLTSDRLAEHWQRLDEFEGEGYERVLAKVRRRDGSSLDAFLYELKDKRPPDARLAG